MPGAGGGGEAPVVRLMELVSGSRSSRKLASESRRGGRTDARTRLQPQLAVRREQSGEDAGRDRWALAVERSCSPRRRDSQTQGGQAIPFSSRAEIQKIGYQKAVVSLLL